MSDYVEIAVGRQDANAFNVGRDEQGPYVFVRDPHAPRFEVSLQDDYLQIAAMPGAPVVSATDVLLEMYVTHPADFSATLRGAFDLERMSGGSPVETVVDGHDWIWRFSPTADPTNLKNYVSDGQTVLGVPFPGIGPLEMVTDYRMTIYWMSQGGSSYNALQVVTFTTAGAGAFQPEPFVKRIAEAPEW